MPQCFPQGLEERDVWSLAETTLTKAGNPPVLKTIALDNKDTCLACDSAICSPRPPPKNAWFLSLPMQIQISRRPLCSSSKALSTASKDGVPASAYTRSVRPPRRDPNSTKQPNSAEASGTRTSAMGTRLLEEGNMTGKHHGIYIYIYLALPMVTHKQ